MKLIKTLEESARFAKSTEERTSIHIDLYITTDGVTVRGTYKIDSKLYQLRASVSYYDLEYERPDFNLLVHEIGLVASQIENVVHGEPTEEEGD